MSVATIDQTKLMEFVGKFVGDFGATLHAPLVLIGERLGLYKAMADIGPMTPAELASHTGTNERYVREWLCAQAASGYAEYDADTGRFSLSPEQAFALANEDGPAYILGAFHIALAMMRDMPKLADAFVTGEGVGWHEHDHALFHGTEKFFRSSYAGNLTSNWIPALDGVEEKIEAGATVADIGCGHGASTILMAQAYPRSRFTGFDIPSRVDRAVRATREAGGRRRRRHVRDRDRQGLSGAAITTSSRVRLPPRLGRPGRCGGPRAPVAQERRGVDDRRAVRERSRRGQSERRRTDLLLGVDDDLHARVAGAGSGAGAGRAGGRGADARGGDRAAGSPAFRRAAETPFNLVLEARP